MQKLFIVITLIFLSAIVATAQSTAAEQKPIPSTKQAEFTKRTETERTIKSTDTPASNGNTQADGKRAETLVSVDGRVIRFGPTTTYLKSGLRADEVLRLLGKPATISERQENGRLLSTYTFARSEGRVFIAEFENGLLVSSHMQSVTTVKQ